jgi:hypothetical protein
MIRHFCVLHSELIDRENLNRKAAAMQDDDVAPRSSGDTKVKGHNHLPLHFLLPVIRTVVNEY